MKNKVETAKKNPSGNFLLFYGHRKSAVVDETCLSQFYGCRFSVGGKMAFAEMSTISFSPADAELLPV